MRNLWNKIVWWFGYFWSGYGVVSIYLNWSRIYWNAWGVIMAVTFMMAFACGSYKLACDLIEWCWDRIPKAYRAIKTRLNRRWL